MGKFNNVRHACWCPVCGAVVRFFQTQDQTNHELTGKTIEPGEGIWSFYSNCDACGAWLEFQYHPPREARWELTVHENRNPLKLEFRVPEEEPKPEEAEDA